LPTPAPRKPQTKPLSMVLGFIWPQNPPPPAHSIGHQDHHHHLIPHTPPHPYIVPRRRLQRRTRNKAPVAWFRIFGPKPPPSHALSNGRMKCHPHTISHTPPTLTNRLHRRLQRHTLNRAITARFRVSGPQLLPWLAFATAPPHGRRRLMRAIPPSPPTSLRRRLTRQNRNRATAARFRVFGPLPPPAPRDHRRLIQATQPPPLTSLPRSLTRQNRNRATAAQFRVFGPQPLPPPARLIGRPDHHHHLTLCYPPTLAVASHHIT
jgi:hypothetical protein